MQGPKKLVQHVDSMDLDEDPFIKLLMVSMEMHKNDFEVSWGSTIFGVHNDGALLYINCRDLANIRYDNSWLNIVVIQLWIM